MTRAVKPRRFAIRPIIYASVLSAGVLLCAFSAHADERDQLKSIQADIAAKERAVRQKQQQRASLLAQLKKQEEAISEATRKLRETQNTLNQLNKQIDEMNASTIASCSQRLKSESGSPGSSLSRNPPFVYSCRISAMFNFAIRLSGSFSLLFLMMISHRYFY